MKQYRSEPLTDKEKRYLRRLKGIKAPFSTDAPAPAFKATRDYSAPVKADFVPRGFGRRVKGLSHEKRLMVLDKASRRAAFFAELGVKL